MGSCLLHICYRIELIRDKNSTVDEITVGRPERLKINVFFSGKVIRITVGLMGK